MGFIDGECCPSSSSGGNVVVVPPTGAVTKNEFNAISSVASFVTTLLLSYTVPALKTANLIRVEFSGTNVADYQVKINTVLQARKRTYFGGGLNEVVEFSDGPFSGFVLNAADLFEVYVTHERPTLGDFEARLELVEA